MQTYAWLLSEQVLESILPEIRLGLGDTDDTIQRLSLQALAALVGVHADVLGSGRRTIFSVSLKAIYSSLLQVGRVFLTALASRKSTPAKRARE